MNERIFTVRRDKSKATPIATEMSCGHIHWGEAPEICQVCAHIKAAEDKRGEEVLEMAKNLRPLELFDDGVEADLSAIGLDHPTEIYAEGRDNGFIECVAALNQAYKERFGES